MHGLQCFSRDLATWLANSTKSGPEVYHVLVCDIPPLTPPPQGGSPFIWFAKLPPTTQALIIVVLILLASPQLAKSVVEIIKALK